MQKGSSFKILYDDLRISIRFASKNILTFLLGMIGVLIVSVVLLVLVLIVFVVGLIAIGGFDYLITFFTDFGLILSEANFTGMMGLGILIALPLISPFFVAVGALFGIGREIVESDGATAEGVFTWYRRRFFALAAGGIILFSTVVVPPALLTAIAFEIMGTTISAAANALIASVSVVWVFFSVGFLSMLFPAIIDGYSPLVAARISIKMGWRYFDRVFATWLGILGMIVLPFAPLVLLIPTSMSPLLMEPIGIALAVYALPMMIIMVLVLLPAAAITLSRVYLILSAIEPNTVEDEHPDLRFVGGI